MLEFKTQYKGSSSNAALIIKSRSRPVDRRTYARNLKKKKVDE
jgi:hypothetical protein